MPLYIRRNVQLIKYCAKLANSSYCSPLLYNCLCIQVHESLKWASYMRGLFNQCGLPYLWNIGVVNIIPIREMKQIIVDQYLQEWSSSLIGKLRLYKLCKERESYLQLSMYLRSALSRLRLSCHSLLIETGRYRRSLWRKGNASFVIWKLLKTKFIFSFIVNFKRISGFCKGIWFKQSRNKILTS